MLAPKANPQTSEMYPFDELHDRVKVINHLGDEVMKVFRVTP
jgi:hypothetical protein